MGDAAARSYVEVLGYQWGMQSDVGGAEAVRSPRSGRPSTGAATTPG